MGIFNPNGALTDATTVIFTAPELPTGGRIAWKLNALTLNNDSGSTSVINIYIVPSGASLGDTNKIVNGLSMIDNSSYGLQEGEKHYLYTGDTLQITASAPHASLVYRASFKQENVYLA